MLGKWLADLKKAETAQSSFAELVDGSFNHRGDGAHANLIWLDRILHPAQSMQNLLSEQFPDGFDSSAF